jgi:hypothetical protein
VASEAEATAFFRLVDGDQDILGRTEGVLSIGMIDPGRQRLIWYGGATTEVGSPKDDKETIKQAVGKILGAFPPPTPHTSM